MVQLSHMVTFKFGQKMMHEKRKTAEQQRKLIIVTKRHLS